MSRLLWSLLAVVSLVGCSGDPDPVGDDDDDTAGETINGRVSTIDGIEVVRLWGTRYQMGYAEGSLYCDKMPVLFKTYILEYLVADYGVPYEMVQMLVDNAVTLEAGDLSELEGIWDGAVDHCDSEDLWVQSEHLEDDANGARELVFEDLLAANVLGDFGCSSLSVWGEASATGDTIHARNFDWAIDPGGEFLAQHMVKVYDSDDEGGVRMASLNVPGLAGCLSCVTEQGAALTMHNVAGLSATQSIGIKPRMFAMREALAATWTSSDPVADAEAILEARPQRVGNNLHLSFPVELGTDGGGAVVFEYDGASDHADGQATVRHPGDDPALATADGIVCTNHYVLRDDPADDGMNTQERYATLVAGIDAGVAAGGLDADGALALIGEVANEYTAHTVVIDSAHREFRVYVAPVPGTPAPEATPSVLDLDQLFTF